MAGDELMRSSIAAYRKFRKTVDEEISERIRNHQRTVSGLKRLRTTLRAAGRKLPSDPLVILAHGDSWFDYPANGNIPTPVETDIIAHLRTLGNPPPIILNISHWGDATTDEMSRLQQDRLIDALSNSGNWMEKGKPDAILFSGGGNDIAGDRFCIFLNFYKPKEEELNKDRFNGALEMIKASYLDLCAFRDNYAAGVPIFGHSYDFPIPDGRAICTGVIGPWLRPSFEHCGWYDIDANTKAIRDALVEFQQTLQHIADDHKNNFKLIPTQKVLQKCDWANELHPYPDGFERLAEIFLKELQSHFKNRI
jgi:hypothetical protein